MKFTEITLIALIFAVAGGIGMLSICIDQSDIPRTVMETALISAKVGAGTFLAVALFLGIIMCAGWILNRVFGPHKTHGH